MLSVVALLLAFSTTPTAIASVSEPPTNAQVAAGIPVTLSKSTEKFTPKSLAGEYTAVVNDAYKRQMENDGIKEISGKILLNTDGTFEFQSLISVSPDRKDTKYSNRDSKIKGDFKVEGNFVLFTSKSETLAGKEIEHISSVVKFTISDNGKALKPLNLTEVSFVKK
jgi:hypothetical protein